MNAACSMAFYLFLRTFIQAQRCKVHNTLPSPLLSSLNLCTQIQLNIYAQVKVYFLYDTQIKGISLSVSNLLDP